MITVVPANIPVTTPDVAPISATEGLLLVHVPPIVALVSVVTLPWHILVLPLMGVSGATVSVIRDTQPAGVV